MLVRLVCSSVNPVDCQIRSGVILKRWGLTVPYPKVRTCKNWVHHQPLGIASLFTCPWSPLPLGCAVCRCWGVTLQGMLWRRMRGPGSRLETQWLPSP